MNLTFIELYLKRGYNLRPSAYSAFAYIYVIKKKGINSPLLECKHNTHKNIYIKYIYREIDIELDEV